MRKFIFIFFTVSAFIGLQSCAPEEDNYINLDDPDQLSQALSQQLENLYGTTSILLLPNSRDYESIPSDPKNPLTDSKVLLGQLLFHETAMGINPVREQGMQTYSCASCHHAKAGFQSGTKQGIGEGGSGFGFFGEGRVPDNLYLSTELDVQPIRTPTVLNTAFQEVMLWNGQFGATGVNEGTEASWEPGTPKESNTLGFQGVETQAIAGLGVHRLRCDPQMIENMPAYKALFDEAFSDSDPSERYSDLNAAKAIAAYERTVLSNEAPFQEWLKGDRDAMNKEQIEGAILFFGKAECYQCHSGPSLSSMSFHALGMNDFVTGDIIGLVDENTKKGRGGFTNKASDMYAFKTPTLYNLKGLNFLGHGGSFSSVKDILHYKNDGIPENKEVPISDLSPNFYPLGLTDTEVKALTAFVEDALFDPNLERYVPDALPSGLCFPVADPLSSEQLDCN
ncbi:cytochrome-c peroxidase [Robiginitalea aurantiaca]|uniref:Cytochrome c peroxidase n=1 Tax=Robiginitalea aurantiaca TaxID=3056915 RepID=A0ABT7WBT4_9FLAO|nr:cytochrome c peroxidase [Robiginitalea aurantiaca]MDM9630378.1 cytochrome c peroxidase [Robiginitalea aurantiaca]